MILRATCAFWMAATLFAVPANATIDIDAAKRAFTEVQAASSEDDGRLWGVPLDGPILFADPATLGAVFLRGLRYDAARGGYLHVPSIVSCNAR